VNQCTDRQVRRCLVKDKPRAKKKHVRKDSVLGQSCTLATSCNAFCLPVQGELTPCLEYTLLVRMQWLHCMPAQAWRSHPKQELSIKLTKFTRLTLDSSLLSRRSHWRPLQAVDLLELSACHRRNSQHFDCFQKHTSWRTGYPLFGQSPCPAHSHSLHSV